MGIILRLIFTFSVRKYPFYVTVGRSRSAKKREPLRGGSLGVVGGATAYIRRNTKPLSK